VTNRRSRRVRYPPYVWLQATSAFVNLGVQNGSFGARQPRHQHTYSGGDYVIAVYGDRFVPAELIQAGKPG
jgi:hypothetical protein